jgi:hypothetical protein
MFPVRYELGLYIGDDGILFVLLNICLLDLRRRATFANSNAFEESH